MVSRGPFQPQLWCFCVNSVLRCAQKLPFPSSGQFSSKLKNHLHLQVIFPGRCVLLCKKSAPSMARTGVLCWGDRSCSEQFLWCERLRLLQHSVCKLIGQDAEGLQLPLALEKWDCSQGFIDTKHVADFIMWGLKARESITRSLAASLQDSSGWTQRSWVLDGNWIFINSCQSVLKQLGHINEFFYYGGKTRYCRDLLPASVWCMRK